MHKLNVRQCPHYVREIWRRSFIPTIRPTVHTNPSRKRNFSKTLFQSKALENVGFSISCGRKTNLKKKLFENDGVTIIMWLSGPSFAQTQNPKWPVIVAFLNFSGIVWTRLKWELEISFFFKKIMVIHEVSVRIRIKRPHKLLNVKSHRFKIYSICLSVCLSVHLSFRLCLPSGRGVKVSSAKKKKEKKIVQLEMEPTIKI